MGRAGIVVVVAALLASGGASQASTTAGGRTASRVAPDQATPIEHLDALAGIGRDLRQRLEEWRPDGTRALSSGGQRLLTLADRIEEVKEAVRHRVDVPSAQGTEALPPGAGSDPYAVEDLLTRAAGMTQSETSVGWCGRNAVIGFNDSGSFVASAALAASPSGSATYNGWSRSTDAGRTYRDMGALVADPLPEGITFRDLLGDPVIGCTSADNFYYASVAMDTGPGLSSSGISVSRSTDGGASWAGAVMAVSELAGIRGHFLDKPWMDVEPGPSPSPADDEIHVTYTDFDMSTALPACPFDFRVAIEYVRSTDGGTTWSSPLVLDEVCELEEGFVQASQVEAGVGSDVYVAWERYTPDETRRDIRIRRSPDGGLTFGDTGVIDAVTPIGDGSNLQGRFPASLDLQGLAVDQSSAASRGAVYVSWHDGRNRSKDDPLGFCGGTPTYCFGDILLARSTDRGVTWSDPVRVNDDDIALGVDQYMPALDVDRRGDVWVAYHDRRRDPRNLLIDTFVAQSRDGGRTWANTRATDRNFVPVTGWQDVLVNDAYMGDYIAADADDTGASPGVITAWGDNSLGDANVRQRRFGGGR